MKASISACSVRTLATPGDEACQIRTGTAATRHTSGIHCAGLSMCRSRISSPVVPITPTASAAKSSFLSVARVSDSREEPSTMRYANDGAHSSAKMRATESLRASLRISLISAKHRAGDRRIPVVGRGHDAEDLCDHAVDADVLERLDGHAALERGTRGDKDRAHRHQLRIV